MKLSKAKKLFRTSAIQIWVDDIAKSDILTQITGMDTGVPSESYVSIPYGTNKPQWSRTPFKATAGAFVINLSSITTKPKRSSLKSRIASLEKMNVKLMADLNALKNEVRQRDRVSGEEYGVLRKIVIDGKPEVAIEGPYGTFQITKKPIGQCNTTNHK